MSVSFAPLKPTERIMVFIDGGYVRRIFSDLFGDDKIDFRGLLRCLLKNYEAIPSNPFRGNLIRVYYYDAIADEEHTKKYREQKRYLTKVTRNFYYTLRLGHLVKLGDGKWRQKGVDILMTVDSLTKAYLDHYDTGLFFLGDRDFIPMIDAVKDAGKKTVGFYYGNPTDGGKLDSKVPIDVGKVFDTRIALSKEVLQKHHVEK